MKKNNNIKPKLVLLLKAILISLVPLLAVVVYTAVKGHGFFSVDIPDSGWNDELFYFKMVEAVLAYKSPRGFFGFNESKALYFSFASWSPVILLQWVSWGILFGWNYISPILSNIVFIGLALFAFVLLVNPKGRECCFIGVLLLVFKPLARYTLSCVPEIELFGTFIVYMGLCLNLLRGKKNYKHLKLVLAYLLVGFMTLIRPYLILFFILPCAIWIIDMRTGAEKKVLKILCPVIITGIVFTITLITYVFIGKNFCAPYLENLYYTDWLKLFIGGNIAEGFSFSLLRIKKSAAELIALITGYIKGDAYYAAGLYYIVYGIILISVTIHLAVMLFNKRHRLAGKIVLLEIQLYIVAVAFGVADILMYRIEPGGRHTLIFTLGGLLLLPFVNTEITSRIDNGRFANLNNNVLPALSVILLVVLFGIKGNIPYEYDLSYSDTGRLGEISLLADEMSRFIDINSETVSYDNTVIWSISSNYSDYYALPAGMGISCCTDDYLITNFDRLKSRYIGVKRGSEVDTLARSKGAEYIGGSKNVSFYKLR